MSTDTSDLTALLGSRICHDLISPLGAIGNGVELLQMAGSVPGPELALITESVANANARIRFFRVAFGAAVAEQRMGRPETVAVLEDAMRGGRITVDWRVEGDQPRREVKLAFLLLQCLESALPWGGAVTVSRVGRHWRIEGAGRKLKADPALWESLSGPATPTQVTAAQVQFALIPAEAARQNRRVQAELGETTITVTF